MALINKLTAIADAIRAKTGGSSPLSLDDMVTEIGNISGGSSPVIESKTITTNGTYTAPNGVDGYSPVVVNVSTDVPWKTISGSLHEFCMFPTQWTPSYLDYVLNTIENTIDIKDLGGAFGYNRQLSSPTFTVPFPINLAKDAKIIFSNQSFFPSYAHKMNIIINQSGTNYIGADNEQINLMFNIRLGEVPADLLKIPLNPMARNFSFHGTTGLLEMPIQWLQTFFDNQDSSKRTYFIYNMHFDEMESMKDCIIPVSHKIITNNEMSDLGKKCYSARRFRFATQSNGDPFVEQWKNLNINLTRQVGWGYKPTYLSFSTFYGNGYAINSAATYDLYKNEPTAYATAVEYSFYNHDSAVETLSSLPDCSAYLTQENATNTIQLTGNSGSATDGGAISTLTAAEIAVATAKGWTVTLV